MLPGNDPGWASHSGRVVCRLQYDDGALGHLSHAFAQNVTT
jgi:hypothetical protein